MNGENTGLFILQGYPLNKQLPHAALLKFFPVQKGVEGGVPLWELRCHVYIAKSKLKPLEFVSSWQKHTFRNCNTGIGYLEF